MIISETYAALRHRMREYSGRLLEGEEAEARDRLAKEMSDLRRELVKSQARFTVSQLWALAIHLALELHEDSYRTVDRAHSPNSTDQPNGCYTKSFDTCCVEAVKQVGLPDEMWYPLMLQADPGTGWINDSVEWADSVLSGATGAEFSTERF